MIDLAEQNNVVVLATIIFDDEIWYGFGGMWVKVKTDNRLPPLKYEQWGTCKERG